jgi:hypothetical protein
MEFSSLPQEVLEIITAKCEDGSRETLRQTCREFKQLVDNISSQPASLKMSDFMSSVPLLTWATASGCPLTHATFGVASKSAPLNVLKELKRRACPQDSRVCYHLAQRGDLEALQWARNNGFGWNYLVCASAPENVLAWLAEIECACGGTYHPRMQKLC